MARRAVVKLSEEQAELVRQPYIGFLATRMPDGSPQVTPIWVDTDGENVLFNTAQGRVKERNLRRDPRVAFSMVDIHAPEDRALAVRGRAEFIDGDGDAHIDKLAKKYLGADEYPWRVQGEKRLIVKIVAESIINPA
jgi:PPOX class probable F420-dependent enzyme